jgi:hypothetical protein
LLKKKIVIPTEPGNCLGVVIPTLSKPKGRDLQFAARCRPLAPPPQQAERLAGDPGRSG